MPYAPVHRSQKVENQDIFFGGVGGENLLAGVGWGVRMARGLIIQIISLVGPGKFQIVLKVTFLGEVETDQVLVCHCVGGRFHFERVISFIFKQWSLPSALLVGIKRKFQGQDTFYIIDSRLAFLM